MQANYKQDVHAKSAVPAARADSFQKQLQAQQPCLHIPMPLMNQHFSQLKEASSIVLNDTSVGIVAGKNVISHISYDLISFASNSECWTCVSTVLNFLKLIVSKYCTVSIGWQECYKRAMVELLNWLTRFECDNSFKHTKKQNSSKKIY